MTKLSKKICKRCVNECAVQAGEEILSWVESDEARWEKKILLCGVKSWHVIEIYEIPECCPYALEHIVLGDKLK